MQLSGSSYQVYAMLFRFKFILILDNAHNLSPTEIMWEMSLCYREQQVDVGGDEQPGAAVSQHYTLHWPVQSQVWSRGGLRCTVWRSDGSNSVINSPAVESEARLDKTVQVCTLAGLEIQFHQVWGHTV